MRDGEDHKRCRHRAGKRGEIDERRPEPEHHREQRGHGRSARAAKDVRFRKRVPEKHLHQDTGNGEQSPDGERRQGARQSQVHDERLNLRGTLAAQRRNRLGQADIGTTRGKRKDKRYGHCDEQYGEQGCATASGH